MVRLLVAFLVLGTSGAALAQTTATMPPGGTNPQGATGGITQDGHVMQGPPATPIAPGEVAAPTTDHPWNSPLPQNSTAPAKPKKARKQGS